MSTAHLDRTASTLHQAPWKKHDIIPITQLGKLELNMTESWVFYHPNTEI